MDIEAVPSPWNHVPRLQGRHVSLEPLGMEHADALGAAVSDGELWQLWYTNVPAPDAAMTYIEKALAQRQAGQALPFAVRDASGTVVGSTRLYALDPVTPRATIGYTWYARRAQRTGLNTEAKMLLLGHAFEILGCIAVAFETSRFNGVSRAAIARLGAREDGILRNHMRHADGSVRDTVVFSILDSEWPTVRGHLQARLESHGHG